MNRIDPTYPMNRNDQLIDERVRESYKEYEVTPPPAVWNRLEQSMASHLLHRRFYLRRTLLGAAAVFLAFIAGYFMATLNPDIPLTTPLDEGSKLTATVRQESSALVDQSRSESSGIQAVQEGNIESVHQASIKKPSRLSGEKMVRLAAMPVTILPQTGYLDAPVDPEPYIRIEYLFVKLPAATVALQAGPTPDKMSDEQHLRWGLSAVAGQTYANYYTGSASDIYGDMYQADLLSTTKEQITKPKVSYGLEVGYRISKRIGVSSGIAYKQFSTSIIPPGESSQIILSSSKPMSSSFGLVQFHDDIRSNLMKSPLLELGYGQLEQSITYIEVPFIGSYRIIDKRIGLTIKGGIGGNILTGNKVLMVQDGHSTDMGTTAGLHTFSFNGIAGADLDYAILPKWNIRFTPVYRHSLHPVSSTLFAKPYIVSFGVYSGITYTF